MKIIKNRYFGYRSFNLEPETMKKIRKIGVDTFTFMVSNNNNFMGEPADLDMGKNLQFLPP